MLFCLTMTCNYWIMHARVHSHVLQNHKPQKPEKKNEKRTKSKGKSSTVFGAHSFQTKKKKKKKKEKKKEKANDHYSQPNHRSGSNRYLTNYGSWKTLIITIIIELNNCSQQCSLKKKDLQSPTSLIKRNWGRNPHNHTRTTCSHLFFWTRLERTAYIESRT